LDQVEVRELAVLLEEAMHVDRESPYPTKTSIPYENQKPRDLKYPDTATGERSVKESYTSELEKQRDVFERI
jgi:hypothetical protein